MTPSRGFASTSTEYQYTNTLLVMIFPRFSTSAWRVSATLRGWKPTFGPFVPLNRSARIVTSGVSSENVRVIVLSTVTSALGGGGSETRGPWIEAVPFARYDARTEGGVKKT